MNEQEREHYARLYWSLLDLITFWQEKTGRAMYEATVGELYQWTLAQAKKPTASCCDGSCKNPLDTPREN